MSGHIEQVKRQQGWSDEQLNLYFTGQGISQADFQDQVRKQLLQRKVIMRVLGDRIRVSEGDVKEYYKTQMTQARTEFELEAAHILLKLPEDPSPVEVARIYEDLRIEVARSGVAARMRSARRPRAAPSGAVAIQRPSSFHLLCSAQPATHPSYGPLQ